MNTIVKKKTAAAGDFAKASTKPSWTNSPAIIAQAKKEFGKATGPIKVYHVGEVKETEAELEKLPIWQRTGTTKVAPTYTSFGYGILPKQPIKDAEIKRHPDYVKVFDLLADLLGGRQSEWTALFLKSVDYWYHHSTDGRKNDEIGRWERYWVAPLAKILHLKNNVVSERTFRRIKDRLVSEKLVEVQTHAKAVNGKAVNCLWIKPTDLLEELIFEEDVWKNFHKTITSAPASDKKSGKKVKSARGLSARIADKRKALKFALNDGWYTLSIEGKMALFDECSTPVDVASSGKRPYRIKPYFSTRGPSYRIKVYLRIAEDMVQEANPIPSEWLKWMESRLPPNTVNPFEGYPGS